MKEEDLKAAYDLKVSKDNLETLVADLDNWTDEQLAKAKLVIELASGGLRKSISMPFDKDDFLALAATKKAELDTELETKGVELKVGT